MSKTLTIIIENRIEDSFPKNIEIIVAEGDRAKNRAIDRARGKFVTFLDSSDSLAPNFFEMFLETAEKYDADVLRGRKFYLLDKDRKLKLATTERYQSQNPIELLPSDRESRILLLIQRKLSQDLSGAIFRRKFLVENRIEFVKNSALLFSIQTLLRAKRYICLDSPSFIRRDQVPEDFSKFILELMDQIPAVEKILNEPRLLEYFLSQSLEKYRGEHIKNLAEILRPIFADETEFIERLIRRALRPIVQASIHEETFFAIK